MLRVLAANFCLVVLCLATNASAGAQTDLGYTRGQVYSGALRYLRIDLGYEITEKDAKAAYLLFQYTPQGQQAPKFGSFEIVPKQGGVRLLVKLPKMPSYHEQVLRDGLLRKLREDYGPETPKAPKKPRDGNRDREDDSPEKSPADDTPTQDDAKRSNPDADERT